MKDGWVAIAFGEYIAEGGGSRTRNAYDAEVFPTFAEADAAARAADPDGSTAFAHEARNATAHRNLCRLLGYPFSEQSAPAAGKEG